jgi:hypothetical protein
VAAGSVVGGIHTALLMVWLTSRLSTVGFNDMTGPVTTMHHFARWYGGYEVGSPQMYP